MRNKILVMILIICMLTGTINPKKSQATGVEIAIVIGVEVVNYLVLTSIASGVAVDDIFEKKNIDDGNWISVVNKDGNQFNLVSGTMYKLKAEYAKSLVDSLSKTQLKTLSDSIVIDKNKMNVKSLGDDLHVSINQMNDLIKSNPKLKSYLNNNTLTGKDINQKQFENVKDILSKFSGIDRAIIRDNPYWIIFPDYYSIKVSEVNTSVSGYTCILSKYPLFLFNSQANLTGDYKQLYYKAYNSTSDLNYKTLKTNNLTSGLVLPRGYEGTNNEFWNNNISIIGNGVMNLGYEEWSAMAKNIFSGQTVLNWEKYVEDITSCYYSIPTSTLLSLSLDTYMPYPKENVRVKEDEDIVIEPISTLENIDDLADYVNAGSVSDTINGRTIDNTDSDVRDKVINPVIDTDKTSNPPIENDLSWLDRLFEWFNKHLTSLGDSIVSGIGAIINALGLTGLIEWIGEICGNILSGVVNGFKSIGNILEWIWELLGTGVISAITGIGSVLGDILEFLLGLIEGLISGFGELLISLFVPSDGYLDAKVLQLRTKFSFADGIIKIVKGFDSALTGTAPPIVKLGSLDESNKYGINNYVLMDLVWFKRYKPTTDIILSAALWVIFIWRMFIKLPGIIAGYSAMTYADAKIDEYNNKQGKGD